MDNKLFNVNGQGKELLLETLELAFKQEGRNEKAESFLITKVDGLILNKYTDEDCSRFASPLTAKECFPMVWSWLQTDEAKETRLDHWCGDEDHGGHNKIGWQVYVGDWGHVGPIGYRALVAIRPAFLWFGK